MRSVGLQVLKNKLSEYVRLVEGGEVVPVSYTHLTLPTSDLV